MAGQMCILLCLVAFQLTNAQWGMQSSMWNQGWYNPWNQPQFSQDDRRYAFCKSTSQFGDELIVSVTRGGQNTEQQSQLPYFMQQQLMQTTQDAETVTFKVYIATNQNSQLQGNAQLVLTQYSSEYMTCDSFKMGNILQGRADIINNQPSFWGQFNFRQQQQPAQPNTGVIGDAIGIRPGITQRFEVTKNLNLENLFGRGMGLCTSHNGVTCATFHPLCCTIGVSKDEALPRNNMVVMGSMNNVNGMNGMNNVNGMTGLNNGMTGLNNGMTGLNTNTGTNLQPGLSTNPGAQAGGGLMFP